MAPEMNKTGYSIRINLQWQAIEKAGGWFCAAEYPGPAGGW